MNKQKLLEELEGVRTKVRALRSDDGLGWIDPIAQPLAQLQRDVEKAIVAVEEG